MQEEVIETKQRYRIHGWLALSPMLVFLLSYLGASLLLNDFYKIPITVAFLLSSCYAVAISSYHPRVIHRRAYQRFF